MSNNAPSLNHSAQEGPFRSTGSADPNRTIRHRQTADAAKVMEIISADKTKIQTYCKLTDMGGEIKIASSAGDMASAA
jgi:hypothetical protein